MMQTLEKRLEELYIQKTKIEEEIAFLTNQIKEKATLNRVKFKVKRHLSMTKPKVSQKFTTHQANYKVKHRFMRTKQKASPNSTTNLEKSPMKLFLNKARLLVASSTMKKAK